jgi:hypothetical protein
MAQINANDAQNTKRNYQRRPPAFNPRIFFMRAHCFSSTSKILHARVSHEGITLAKKKARMERAFL